MQPVGPYTLALNQTVTVPRPGGDGTAWDRVLLTNASPYICAVNINGGQKWLPGYTEALYDAEPGSTVQVTPELVLAGGGIDSTLLATFYAPDDPDDSANYPAQLTSTAVAATIAGAVGVENANGTNLLVSPDQVKVLGNIYTSDGNGNVTFTVPNIPAATKRLAFLFNVVNASSYGLSSGQLNAYFVTGGTNQYVAVEAQCAGPNVTEGSMNADVPFLGSLASSCNCQLTIASQPGGTNAIAGATVVVNVVALFDSEPEGGNPTEGLYVKPSIDTSMSTAFGKPFSTATQVLVNAPSAGYANRLGTITIANNSGGVVFVNITDYTGAGFFTAFVPSGQSLSRPGGDLTPSYVEANCSSSGAGYISGTYQQVPL